MSLFFQSLSHRSIQRGWLGAILLVVIAIGLASCNSTAPTSVPSTETAFASAVASPTYTQTASALAPTNTNTPTRTLTLPPSPTVSGTPAVLLSSPLLNQPQDRASFSSGSFVTLTWAWQRALVADEYFEIQLSRLDTELKDWACSSTTSFEIRQAPFGDGWYQWRIVARRGRIIAQQCMASQDLTTPSETRTFEWRPLAQSTQAPLPPPTPTRLALPPPTPTKRPYP